MTSIKRKARTTVLSPVGRQIQEALATFLRRAPSTVKPEHLLREDLGLDSLMTFELLYELEKAFDLEIPNEDLPGLQTLADIVGYVEARLRSAAPSVKAAPTPSRSGKTRRRQKDAIPSTGKAPGKSKSQATTNVKQRASKPATKKPAALAKSKGKKS